MFYGIAKRLIDIFGAVVLMIVFSPLLLLIPILIILDSPGPVFADIPERVGKNKKLFKMFKFRSMIVNAHERMKTEPQFKELYEEYKRNSYKISLDKDPRVTGVGRFLRRFSLDELPQVINVLRGEMSLVGPRAYYPDELKNQEKVFPQSKEHIKELLKVKPGVTGYWQVTGRSEINFDQRVQMDAEYAGKKSVFEDLRIIFKTPWAMLSGKGAL